MQSSVSLKRLLSEYHTTNNPKAEYARTYKERAGVKLKVRGEKPHNINKYTARTLQGSNVHLFIGPRGRSEHNSESQPESQI